MSCANTSGASVNAGTEFVESYRAAGATWWLESLTPPYFGSEWQDTWPLDAMRERVLLAGGEYQLETAPGKGTRIAFTIPLGADI